MAKAPAAPDYVNPTAPPEADALVRDLIAANPGVLTPASFSFRVFHKNDPTTAGGRFVGKIAYERFSEEGVAEAFGIAGDFYADLVSNSTAARGNLRRIHFGVGENLVPAKPTAPTAPGAGLGGTPAVPTGGGVLDVLLPMFLESQRQQGALMIALATKPAPASGMSDAVMSTILGHALTKSPVSDVVSLAEKLAGKLGEKDEPEERGGGMGVEVVRTLRQLLTMAEKHPGVAPAAPVAHTTPAPGAGGATAPGPGASPAAAPSNGGGAERPDPAKLGEIERFALFGSRAVPMLIEYATDPEPSIEAAAAMIEAQAIRAGIDPAKFAEADDIDADVIDPVLAHFPELAPHRAFAKAAVEAVAEDYAEDEDEKPE